MVGGPTAAILAAEKILAEQVSAVLLISRAVFINDSLECIRCRRSNWVGAGASREGPIHHIATRQWTSSPARQKLYKQALCDNRTMQT